MAEAAEKVKKASRLEKVFFTNSGTEAIEGALKVARKYSYAKYGENRYEIIAMNHSFHGRSMGALSVTGNEKYRKPFEPLIGGVRFADYNDLESVKSQLTDKTCGIILETVQGEGGIYPATEEFLKGVQALCEEHDLVLILDEILGLVDLGIITCEDVIRLIDMKDESVELIMTGRHLPEELIPYADYISRLDIVKGACSEKPSCM